MKSEEEAKIEVFLVSEVPADLICQLVLLLIVKGQLLVQHVVEILLHEDHGVGETVLLVVSAVIHV